MTETPYQAERYAALERSVEAQRKRSIARGPIGLIAVLLLLSLGVGIVAAVDLRRLQTPRGAALAWTTAVVFGDCTAYERQSVPPEGLGEVRSDEEVCSDLLRETAAARDAPQEYGVELLDVQQNGEAASAVVEVRRPEETVELDLQIVRRGEGWAVVRTFELCLEIGCP